MLLALARQADSAFYDGTAFFALRHLSITALHLSEDVQAQLACQRQFCTFLCAAVDAAAPSVGGSAKAWLDSVANHLQQYCPVDVDGQQDHVVLVAALAAQRSAELISAALTGAPQQPYTCTRIGVSADQAEICTFRLFAHLVRALIAELRKLPTWPSLSNSGLPRMLLGDLSLLPNFLLHTIHVPADALSKPLLWETVTAVWRSVRDQAAWLAFPEISALEFVHVSARPGLCFPVDLSPVIELLQLPPAAYPLPRGRLFARWIAVTRILSDRQLRLEQSPESVALPPPLAPAAMTHSSPALREPAVQPSADDDDDDIKVTK